MTTESMRRYRARVRRDDALAEMRARGGKRVDESGTFQIPAKIYRRDRWERAFLQRALAPVGSIVGKPTYMPVAGAYEFEWRRTRFEVRS